MLAPLISLLVAAAPDTTRTAFPALKLGLVTTATGLMPTLAAEWQLRPRLTLTTRLGVSAQSFHRVYEQYQPDNAVVSLPYTYQVRQAEVATQVRYYLQGRNQALTGWHGGLGLGLTRLREAAFRPQAGTESRTRLLLSPQAQAGRQWLFGRHVLVDLFLGLGAAPYRDFSFAPNPVSHWDFYAAHGVQLGYAF